MKILIIGCGYLGYKVAEIFKKKGNSVTTTTRSPERLDLLAKVSTKSVIVKNEDLEALSLLLEENDAIIVTIAADNPEEYENAYLNTSKAIRAIAKGPQSPKILVYTSSTSVYGDHHGRWVDEEAPLLAKTDQGKILIEAENIYLSLQEFDWKPCILRLSEIYGPERSFSKRVQKKQGITLPGDGSQYSNMIHRDDAAHAVQYALEHHLEGIYNVSDEDHPTRKELYEKVAEKYNYQKLKWDPKHATLHYGNKRVANHKLKKEGFALLHPHRILD